MPTCPQGHNSDSGDYCDVCGVLIGGTPAPAPSQGNASMSAPMSAPVSAPGSAPAATDTCPEPGCGAPRTGRFCEECGYDFATGTPGFGPVSGNFGPAGGAPGPAPGGYGPAGGGAYGPATGGYGPPTGGGYGPATGGYAPSTGARAPGTGGVATGGHGYPGTGHPGMPHTGPQQPGVQQPGAGQPGPPHTGWHVVVGADRRYYETVIAQGGPDAAKIVFPPYCPERFFPLAGREVRIGRRSRSRGIIPEIDLSGVPEDPGISHLHAVLVAQPDGSWTLLDPGSANGTKINEATDPIAGNVPVPVGDGDRIYIGAWTVIVLRKG